MSYHMPGMSQVSIGVTYFGKGAYIAHPFLLCIVKMFMI